MASIPVLQQALDRVLDAEPWDPVAVERARTKLDIAKRARDDEAHAEAAAEMRKLRQAQLAHEEELYLLQKARLLDEPLVPSNTRYARSRERTPPPASRPQPRAAARSVSPALGLEVELPQPAPTAGIDLAAPDQGAPLLPRLLASFRADFAQQCGTVSGMLPLARVFSVFRPVCPVGFDIISI